MGESFDPRQGAEFDRYAGSGEDAHAHGIGVSGESAEHVAIYKQRVLERLLGKKFDRPVLDFGCGIGNLTHMLARSFPVVHGYDPSSESTRVAKMRTPSATFFDDPEALPKNHYGCVVLANVLLHVPPPNRRGLMKMVVDVLAPGGRLVIFEHNPLNPVARRAAASAFDENAELLYPWQIKRLLRGAGLRRVELDYIAFFPQLLAIARPLESSLSWLPLGAQVCAWGAKR
jgi:SAM-dependent methyltransferase